MVRRNRKPIVMVSSSVYGIEDLLERVFAILSENYEVWMSYKGTIPVNPDLPSIDNCLAAVKKCDLFLGIITPHYGSTKCGKISATHAEFREAIRLKKLRWFLVEEHVEFARKIFNKLKIDRVAVVRDRVSVEGCKVFDDLAILDMYDEVVGKRKTANGTKANWVQSYAVDEDACIFAKSQFSRPEDLEALLHKRLDDPTYLTECMKKWEGRHE